MLDIYGFSLSVCFYYVFYNLFQSADNTYLINTDIMINGYFLLSFSWEIYDGRF